MTRRGKDNVVSLTVRGETDRLTALEDQVCRQGMVIDVAMREIAELKWAAQSG